MPAHRDHNADDDWQPATSAPGEMYTPEGQIRSYRNLARGLTDKDPRRKPFRRSMQRAGLLVIAIAVGLVAIVVLLRAVL